jgi:hypothetical protein
MELTGFYRHVSTSSEAIGYLHLHCYSEFLKSWDYLNTGLFSSAILYAEPGTPLYYNDTEVVSMLVYPVRYWSKAEDASIKHVRVRPFTSNVDARKFHKELQDRKKPNGEPAVETELLAPEKYTLNKAGVVAAFERSQKLMLEADFLNGK